MARIKLEGLHYRFNSLQYLLAHATGPERERGKLAHGDTRLSHPAIKNVLGYDPFSLSSHPCRMIGVSTEVFFAMRSLSTVANDEASF